MSMQSWSQEPTVAIDTVPQPGAGKDAAKLIACSALGIFMFFIPITYQDKTSIPLDHLVTIVRSLLGPVVPWLLLGLIAFGTVRPFVQGTWRASSTKTIFALLNIVGFIAAIMMVTNPPSWLDQPGIGPFLWGTLVGSVGLIVPIGAIFLGFLIGFGLMEFVGVFVRPIMKPLWKTPGRSAVDAVASFVGSYSLGLLLTNRVYKSGGYTAKEASIIAVGFSTVSVTFMVVVANALNIMDHWLLYFFTSLLITYLVTAVLVRIPPLSLIPDEYYPGVTPQPEKAVGRDKFKVAWAQARATLQASPGIAATMWHNFKDGLLMASSILPSIMSVGLIGILLGRHTPLFDWVGWLLYPFTWVAGMADPAGAGKAVALGYVEMFLPASAIGPEADLTTRFIIAVVCVSAVIFLSAMVPSILATDIPLKFWHLTVIWFERVILSIVLTAPIAHLLL